MQCCALKQRAVTVLSLYHQTVSPYPRKTGMEARDLGRVRLHVYRKEYNEIVNRAMNHPVGNIMYKIRQIKRILMEEFPREANDEKAELVANRLYDQIMYEDKDV